jgi:MoaA/NifB/PqqE/SkfB family radical SAM enzyme
MSHRWNSPLNRLRELILGRTAKIEYLHIETSNECNFRCKMCPLIVLRGGGSLGRGMMSFADFKTILDKIPLRDIRSASVQGFGEAMLNPDFLKIARYAKGKGLHVSFNSNMSLLTAELAQGLIDIGVDEVDFSIDSTDVALFAQLREGIPLPRLLENLACFLDLRARNGALKPDLGFRVVASRWNLGGAAEILELARSMRVSRVVFQDLAGADSDEQIRSHRLDQAEYAQLKSLCRQPCYLDSGMDIQVENFNRLQPRDPGKSLCRAPWSEVYVRVDGFLTPCCQVQDPSILGHANLLTQGFDEIWNGPVYRKFRAELKQGRPLGCGSCTVY